jgi:hypothetical protein
MHSLVRWTFESNHTGILACMKPNITTFAANLIHVAVNSYFQRQLNIYVGLM